MQGDVSPLVHCRFGNRGLILEQIGRYLRYVNPTQDGLVRVRVALRLELRGRLRRDVSVL